MEKRLILISALLWLLLMMWLSAQTGTATNLTSTRLAAMLLRMTGISPVHLASVNHALRTLAHLVLFCILGMAVYSAAWAMCACRAAALRSFVLCCVMAVTDEAKKIMIAGRHPSWNEMGLNCVGAALGIGAAVYCLWVFARRSRAAYRGRAAGAEPLRP